MQTLEIVQANLLSPMVLAFVLGMIARLLRSDVSLPESVVKFMSTYLLFNIGITGGLELSKASFAVFWPGTLAVLVLATLIPVLSYVFLRHVGKFDPANAAALAAHYGSVSSVTFIAGINMLKTLNVSYEGFMPSLAALMEWGLIVGLFIGQLVTKSPGTKFSSVIRETLTGKSLILLVGGITMGAIIGEDGYQPIKPFVGDLFRGILVFFLLEMGMDAAKQLSQFAQKSLILLAYGTLMPVFHGILGITAGYLVGLSQGGSFILGVLAASASYIDAPPAVRSTLPSANPSLYLTASLGITLPFNLIVGLPLYWYITTLFFPVF